MAAAAPEHSDSRPGILHSLFIILIQVFQDDLADDLNGFAAIGREFLEVGFDSGGFTLHGENLEGDEWLRRGAPMGTQY
jgi:hypothetical protein